jgi:hypothetical protein
MRIFLLILFCLGSSELFSQSAPAEDTSVTMMTIKSIPEFVDSLREKLLTDTSKFNADHIVNTSKGKRNMNSYSPLLFINIRFQYKLDIVPAGEVIQFVDEILVADKIERISILDQPKSVKIFGPNGINGAILIQLKPGAEVDFNIAGFKPDRNVGNNFY